MKYLILVSFVLFFLTSCGKSERENTWTGVTVEKTPFILKTEKLSDFSGSTLVEKSWRITASSSLTLTSKWAWEIGKILVKEGQYVRAGTTVAILRDTVNNFDLRLDQAENALLQQNASIASTEANMNTSIDAARIALARARLAYDNANSRKNIQSLTLTTTNQRTVESYNILYKNYLSDIERQMTQMLYSGDRILGITTNAEYANDPWEANLGARNSGTYSTALSEWNKLYGTRGELRARIEKGIYITAGSAYADLDYISNLYDKVQKFADAMINMLQNNVVWGWLSQMQQDGWTAEWNGIRAQIQASLWWYGWWKAQVLGFLKTYEAIEKATDLAIVSLTRTLTPAEKSIIEGSNDMRVTYETTRIALRDSIENARLGLEQAESSYNNALTVKNATLTQMRVMRANADIALAQARRDYAKLSISAPVDGSITKLRTSVGETINPGSPIADFAGKKPEIIIDIDPGLAENLGVGDSVDVIIGEQEIGGRITAVSSVAGTNLLSTVRIAVDEWQKYIGQSVIVRFRNLGTIDSKKVLLPIDAIKILSEWEWEISLLTSDKTIIKKVVQIENIGWANAEISGDLAPGDIVITSDISNYDAEKNTLQIQ
jgi:multidrug resistance efflux pump